MNKKRFIILLTTIFFILSIPVVTSARAGGESSGGSSSSSSSSSSSNYNNPYNDYGGNSRSGPIGTILAFIFIMCIRFKNKVILAFKIIIKTSAAKKVINSVSKNDERWNYNLIKPRIKETFHIVQKSWALRDANYAENYTSKDLLERHKSKLEWMICKHELNILKHIKLIQALPVAAVYSINNEYNHIWFYIKGSMVDYTINDMTSEIIDGGTKSKMFSEYWKFIKVNDVWVLDKICQIDDIDIDDLNNQYEMI